MERLVRHGLGDGVDRCAIDVEMADLRHRSHIAATHAGGAHDADVPAERTGQTFKQLPCAHHFAGEAVADPDRDGGRRRIPFLHHVEMRVKRRHLVHLGHRQAHLMRQRREMGSREVTVGVLNQVQILDQKVPPAWTIAKQRLDLLER